MQSGRIFLVGDAVNTLTPMAETAFATEDVLQRLLEDYPDLLPGDQINPESPRRWLLVAREMGVPDAANQPDRWSLDHLYLDQNAKPTFVECKRSSDTRARREVVAQMLDYAANGLAHWSVDRLRQAATATAARRGREIDAEVRELVGTPEDVDVEDFWKQVEDNLRAGRVRLIFVGDSIPSELRRLVEFLNDRLADVEVLAVEVKQFLGEGVHKVIVPRLIGMTERARGKVELSEPKAKTTPKQFLEACTPIAQQVFVWMLKEAQQRGYMIYWGTKGFSIRKAVQGPMKSFLYGYPHERLEVYLGHFDLDTDVVAQLRTAWLGLGLFGAYGDYTLRPNLAVTPRDDIIKALTTIMDDVDRLG